MSRKRSLTNRKLDKELSKHLKHMGRIIDDYVDYGNEMYEVLGRKFGDNEFNAPIFSTFMHILNMADNISTIIKKGSSDGVKPLLRSLFETQLYFEYMLKEDKNKGVLAYQVFHAHTQIKIRKMMDSNTQQGKEVHKKYKEELGSYINDIPETKSNKHLYAFLEREEVKKVNEEYRMSKKKNWFSLYSEINNLKDLAEYLGKVSMYNVIYKDLSNFIHGGSTMEMIKIVDGKGVLPPIRNPELIPTYFQITVTLMNQIYRLIDEKQLAHLYMKHRKDFFTLSNLKIKVEYSVK